MSARLVILAGSDQSSPGGVSRRWMTYEVSNMSSHLVISEVMMMEEVMMMIIMMIARISGQ
jgi:hypothetical protein